MKIIRFLLSFILLISLFSCSNDDPVIIKEDTNVLGQGPLYRIKQLYERSISKQLLKSSSEDLTWKRPEILTTINREPIWDESKILKQNHDTLLISVPLKDYDQEIRQELLITEIGASIDIYICRKEDKETEINKGLYLYTDANYFYLLQDFYNEDGNISTYIVNKQEINSKYISESDNPFNYENIQEITLIIRDEDKVLPSKKTKQGKENPYKPPYRPTPVNPINPGTPVNPPYQPVPVPPGRPGRPTNPPLQPEQPTTPTGPIRDNPIFLPGGNGSRPEEAPWHVQVYLHPEKTAEIKARFYKEMDIILQDKTVAEAVKKTWSNTLKDASKEKGRRERGFWIYYNKSERKYYVGDEKIQEEYVKGIGTNGSIKPGNSQPKNNGSHIPITAEPLFFFHSHTPLTYEEPGARRPVGPSESDINYAKEQKIKMALIDYVGKEADHIKGDYYIKWGHKLDDPFRIYVFGSNLK